MPRIRARAPAGAAAPILPASDETLVRAASLLTPPLAARRLTVAVQTLARWRVEGTGPAFLKIGGRVAYRADDLDAWVEARRFTSTSDRRTG